MALVAAVALTTAACQETLDAGHSRSHGLLPPIDERNPVILYNDAEHDNWCGEYAVLFANSGRLRLAGLIVTASSYWGDLTANTSEWKDLLASAQSSGLANLPSVTPSVAPALKRPADGAIESTDRNESDGARLIVNLSKAIAQPPARPIAVIAGTQLTDLADAYLIDPTVVDRVVVVASLGAYSAPTATMEGPNGELDPWADWIVAHRFRYVQISAYYQQASDVAASDLASLPQTPFGDWMRNKQAGIFTRPQASDQIAVLSVALPDFATEVKQVSPDPSATVDSMFGPPLIPDVAGKAWVVTKIASPLAKARLWDLLIPGGG